MRAPESEPVRARSSSACAAALSALVLLVALLMHADTAHATLFGFSGLPCPAGTLLGESVCPGCGLTRSTALVMHGRFAEALRLHAGGFFVVFACLAGFLVHGHSLLVRHRSPRHDALLRAGRVLFVAGIVAGWAAKLAGSA